LRIVDTIVSREGENSAWANVVFLGDTGESVSVRLPYCIPTGGEIGRNRLIKRATAMLRNLVTCEAFDTLGESGWTLRSGRFGAASEAVIVQPDALSGWRSTKSSG
jgi:hypothetical protein